MRNIVQGTLLVFLLSATAIGQQKIYSLQFSVFDNDGNPVSGLKASDVRLREGNKELVIESFNELSDRSLEILVLIDNSVSQQKVLPKLKSCVAALIDTELRSGKDHVGVASFTGEIVLVQDMTSDLSQAKAAIESIKFTPPTGYIGGGVTQVPPISSPTDMVAAGTSIWDSIKRGNDALAATANTERRKVLLVVTDGYNTSGKVKFEVAAETADLNQIPLFVIGVGDDKYEGVDQRTLQRLVRQTNGFAVFPNKILSDCNQLNARLLKAMRSTYDVKFSLTGAKNGKEDVKIEPRVTGKKLELTRHTFPKVIN